MWDVMRCRAAVIWSSGEEIEGGAVDGGWAVDISTGLSVSACFSAIVSLGCFNRSSDTF